MKFTLIIPTHNRKDLLRACLRAATTQNHGDFEIILVDDASSDGTDALVKAEYPQINYLHLDVNRGPAAARNRGIAAARGEVLVFTDDDCLLPPEFLSALEVGYRQYPAAAGVGGYLEPPQDLVTSNPWARYEVYVTHQIYKAGSEPVLGGMGCPAGGTNSMSYYKRILDEAGGFDESFPVPGGEDTDLKRRIVDAGHQVLYLPLKVIHLHEYDLPHFWRKQYTHGRGSIHFEKKYDGRPPSGFRLFLRAGKRTLRWLVNLSHLRDVRLATAIFVADIANLFGQISEVWTMRRVLEGQKTGATDYQ